MLKERLKSTSPVHGWKTPRTVNTGDGDEQPCLCWKSRGLGIFLCFHWVAAASSELASCPSEISQGGAPRLKWYRIDRGNELRIPSLVLVSCGYVVLIPFLVLLQSKRGHELLQHGHDLQKRGIYIYIFSPAVSVLGEHSHDSRANWHGRF